MRTYILIFLSLFMPLHAENIEAGYDVSFGIFGEIGKAEISYTYDEDSYVIYVHAWTTGVAALLSQERQEDYISQGKIVDGKLRPDVFVKYRKNNRYTKTNIYTFDHDNKKVHEYLSRDTLTQHSRLDVNTMKNIKIDAKVFEYTEEVFRFYTDNDLLSLFFNTQKMLSTYKEGEAKHLAAIGSRSPNCEIDIEVPNEELREELQAIMPDNYGRLLTIIINQDIFQSERGELHVNFDEDSFAQDVLLKDVIMFGDIRGTRTYQNKQGKPSIKKITLN